MGIFSTDNRIFRLIGKLADMIILSVLWCILSLPFFTLGAASAALYRSSVVSIRQDCGNTVRDFFRSFLQNLKQGALLMLLCLPAVVFIAASFLYGYACRGEGILPVVYFSLSIVTALVLLTLLIDMFALLGRFTLTNRQIIRIALAMLPGCFFRNLLLLAGILASAALTVLYPPFLLLVPGGFCFLASFLLEKMFPKFVSFTDSRLAGAAQQ